MISNIPYLRVLSEPELAYIACAFDGEGWIGINRSKPKGYNYSYSTQANVYNTNLIFLNWLKDKTRIGQIISKYRYNC